MDCCGERRGGAKESTNSYIAKFTQYLPNTRKNGRVMGIYPYLTTHQNSVRRSTQYPITQQKTEWVHSPAPEAWHAKNGIVGVLPYDDVVCTSFWPRLLVNI